MLDGDHWGDLALSTLPCNHSKLPHLRRTTVLLCCLQCLTQIISTLTATGFLWFKSHWSCSKQYTYIYAIQFVPLLSSPLFPNSCLKSFLQVEKGWACKIMCSKKRRSVKSVLHTRSPQKYKHCLRVSRVQWWTLAH